MEESTAEIYNDPRLLCQLKEIRDQIDLVPTGSVIAIRLSRPLLPTTEHIFGLTGHRFSQIAYNVYTLKHRAYIIKKPHRVHKPDLRYTDIFSRFIRDNKPK